MRLIEVIYLSLAAATLIIGIHQSMTVGIIESYWIFMFSIVFLMAFKLNLEKRGKKDQPVELQEKKENKPKAKVRKK